MALDAEHFATIDKNIAANLREVREARGISQEELAQRMAERGFGFSQATVWKIEQGKRPVRHSEALGFADALELTFLQDLTRSPGSFRHSVRLQDANHAARIAYEEVKDAVTKYIDAQIHLAFTAHDAEEGGYHVHEDWLGWLTLPAERAVIEARVEYDQQEEQHERVDGTVEKIIQSLRDHGHDPTFDYRDIHTAAEEPRTTGQEGESS